MDTTKTIDLIWLCSLLALGACGQDAVLLTAVPEGQARLSTLSEAQTQALCKDLSSNYSEDELKHVACLVVVGLADAFISTASEAERLSECQATYEACMAGELEQGSPEPCSIDGAGTCDATADEWLTCQRDQSDLVIEMLRGSTCADVIESTNASDPTQMSPLNDLPSCQRLTEKCPDLSRPTSRCNVQLTTAGAFDTDLDVATTDCGSYGRTADKTATISFESERAPFVAVEVSVPSQRADFGDDKPVTVEVIRSNSLVSWRFEDCTARVTATSCKTLDGDAGRKYRYEDGSCATAATSTIAPDLELLSFSAETDCIEDEL